MFTCIYRYTYIHIYIYIYIYTHTYIYTDAISDLWQAKFELDLLFAHCRKVIQQKGHCVLVVAEGAGQEFFQDVDLGKDPSGQHNFLKK